MKIIMRTDACTFEEFVEKSREIHADLYEYNSEFYKNSSSNTVIFCKIHGEFTQRANGHMQGRGCRKCGVLKSATSHTRSTAEFILDAIKIHRDLYDYSKVDYTHSYKKLEIICKHHGSFYQAPNSHLRYKGCPRCSNSKGEEQISRYLETHNILYNREYIFPNQGSEIKLCRFDFYLPEINMVIEFHGKQHYKYHKHFHKTLEEFEQRKRRDILKRDYCVMNGIEYLEIKWNKMKHIKDILDKYIYYRV